MTESERCARIAESQIVGAAGDARIRLMVSCMRDGSDFPLTAAQQRARCLKLAQMQLLDDNADDRIQAIIDAIVDGAEAD